MNGKARQPIRPTSSNNGKGLQLSRLFFLDTPHGPWYTPFDWMKKAGERVIAAEGAKLSGNRTVFWQTSGKSPKNMCAPKLCFSGRPWSNPSCGRTAFLLEQAAAHQAASLRKPAASQMENLSGKKTERIFLMRFFCCHKSSTIKDHQIKNMTNW